ncbi:Protein required for attachment to host cells [Aliiroseovarius sediminilitoris]|uniref:Protein required for attachment to host cells n=1 Tax=Aliiroseovarius sediminilitoris TaxID=1173584 RepID=A0A1I0QA44_9RHOB|nr:host attachment family protein [Aliiroseovarius sediminilitoris]SEW23868.1 Protein required for attachment to host cells [Aliiroseovarius sediminilitoris]
MRKLQKGTWVLIADGEKALFLVNEGSALHPKLQVLRKEEQDNPAIREQAANRRGRVHQSANQGKSAYEDTDWHQLGKERFAQDLAEHLYRKAHKDQFSHLVICAAPDILAVLRDEIHQEVRRRVIAEVPKTLTNHPLDEVAKIICADLEAQS